MNEPNNAASREDENRARQNPNYCPPHVSSRPYNPVRVFNEVLKLRRWR